MPKNTGVRAPRFLTLVQRELLNCLHIERDPLMTQVYLLLLCISDFKTGEVVTSYAYLAEMTSPPEREKGGRRGSTSEKQMQRRVAKLITYGLVARNPARNESQGVLRLRVRRLEVSQEKAAPVRSNGRGSGRVVEKSKPSK